MGTQSITLEDFGEEARKVFNTLSPQTIKWIELVIAGTNPSDAYRMAYEYVGKNAPHLARKLAVRKDVSAIITEYRALLSDRFKITEPKILAAYARMAFADIRDCFNEDGDMLQLKDWPRELADLVAGFDYEDLFEGAGKERKHVGQTVKIRLNNRQAALDALAKTQGLFMVDKGKRGDKAGKRVVMPAGQDKVSWLKEHGIKAVQ